MDSEHGHQELTYSFVQWSKLIDGCQVVSSHEDVDVVDVVDTEAGVATEAELSFSLISCAPIVSDTPEQASRTTQSLP